MAQPWKTIDAQDTRDGKLELRQRGERDFLILISNRVLMNSSANRSEMELGKGACALVASRPHPRVLIGGLGMGLTLRAALDVLPATAEVVVAELNSAVAAWCRGPLAVISNSVLTDPRVTIVLDDVAAVIAKASLPGAKRFDAIIIDLYEGPHAGTDSGRDPFYGTRALKTTHAALALGGVFAIWGEARDAAFEKRLAAAGFSLEVQRPGRGGLRHAVYTAVKR